MYKVGGDCFVILAVAMIWISSPKSLYCEAMPITSVQTIIPSSEQSGVAGYHQLHSYLRGVLKYLDSYNKNQQKQITGQVNSRAPRSEFGELGNAVRLYQLQELDRMYGTKSRSRFGKRSEVTQADGPSYGYGQDYNNMFAEEEEGEVERR